MRETQLHVAFRRQVFLNDWTAIGRAGDLPVDSCRAGMVCQPKLQEGVAQFGSLFRAVSLHPSHTGVGFRSIAHIQPGIADQE